MTSGQITEIIKEGEGDRVERTVSTNNTDKFSEAVCAFANDLPLYHMPGYLLIGVRDDGSCQVSRWMMHCLKI